MKRIESVKEAFTHTADIEISKSTGHDIVIKKLHIVRTHTYYAFFEKNAKRVSHKTDLKAVGLVVSDLFTLFAMGFGKMSALQKVKE